MVGITTYTSLSSSRVTGSSTSATAQPVAADDKTGATTSTGSTGTSSTVSNLARQLSEAAVRAETRDTSLSHKELGQKATALLNQITGDSYFANKAQHNAEVPNTDDPELLARAKQATSFVNGSGSNPFKGMSRDQLALITYDDSGTFTTNERRAAWEEAYSQEEAWRQKAVAKAMDEYNRTGKLTNFFSEVLEHYKSLPAIVVLAIVAEFFGQAIHMGQIGALFLGIGVHLRDQRAILAGEELEGAATDVAGAHALGAVGDLGLGAAEQARDHEVVPDGAGCAGG